MPVAPVISQPAPQPTVQPVSTGYSAPAPTGYSGGGYGSQTASFNSQPPKQYGNEETMHKQVSYSSIAMQCYCVLFILWLDFHVDCYLRFGTFWHYFASFQF